MNRQRLFSKKLATPLAVITILSSLCGSIEAQAPDWGVLNVAGQDMYTGGGLGQGLNADALIGLAESSSGDTHTSHTDPTAPGSCSTGNAATYVANAVTAFTQWSDADYAGDGTHRVRLVEIVAKWQYYQPDYQSQGSASSFDRPYDVLGAPEYSSSMHVGAPSPIALTLLTKTNRSIPHAAAAASTLRVPSTL